MAVSQYDPRAQPAIKKDRLGTVYVFRDSFPGENNVILAVVDSHGVGEYKIEGTLSSSNAVIAEVTAREVVDRGYTLVLNKDKNGNSRPMSHQAESALLKRLAEEKQLVVVAK